MHTPLQIRERDVLRNLTTRHPIYLLVKNIVLELDEQCLHFHLTPEDVFIETLDLVDAIRETSEEQAYDVIEHCQRLKSHYKTIAANHEAIKDINLWLAIIMYSASSALSMVKTKPYKSVASVLRNLISPQHFKLILPYLNTAILKLANVQLEEWDQYFFSEKFLSEELITAIENADYCIYIVREEFNDNKLYTLDQYQNAMREHCLLGAKSLVDFLQRGEKLGYLHFFGHDLKKIFETIKGAFPFTISYTYTHFANTTKEFHWHERNKT